ncbi:hypothetical protein HK097_002760, partial [Rhizophlyctis rosea]
MSPTEKSLLYAPDPFTAGETHVKEKEEKAKEIVRERERKVVERERKVEGMFPAVEMGERLREEVEGLVKELGKGVLEGGGMGAGATAG